MTLAGCATAGDDTADPACSNLAAFEGAGDRLDAPAVFDLDRNGLSDALRHRREVLAEVRDETRGELEDLISQLVDMHAVGDRALLASWAADRARLEGFGQDWETRAYGEVIVLEDGPVPALELVALTAQVHEQLAVRCHARELLNGPRQDDSGNPPDMAIDFFHPDRAERLAQNPSSSVEPQPGLRTTGWTSLRDVDMAPSGRRIAALAQRDGTFGLVVVDTDGAVVATLDEGPARYLCPAWSPDEESVLAVDASRKLHRFGIDGSHEVLRLGFEQVGCAAWVSDRRLLVSGAARHEGDTSGVWLVGTDGGHAERVPLPDCNSAVGGLDRERATAALSLRCRDPLDNGLWLVDVADLEARHVVTANVAVPKWSPDGEWLAFGLTPLGADVDEEIAVWISRRSGEGLHQVSEPPTSYPIWFDRPG